MVLCVCLLCRDPAKKKDEVKAKQREEAKPKLKPTGKREDEGDWETVAKRATGQMTKQVRHCSSWWLIHIHSTYVHVDTVCPVAKHKEKDCSTVLYIHVPLNSEGPCYCDICTGYPSGVVW